MPFVGSEGFHFQHRGGACLLQVKYQPDAAVTCLLLENRRGRLLATTASG